MLEIGLMYLGKKRGIFLSPDYLPKPLHFAGRKAVQFVREDHAKRLMSDNPRMFMIVDQQLPEGSELVEFEAAVMDAEEVMEDRLPETPPLEEPSELSEEELAAIDPAKILDDDAPKETRPLSQMNKTQLAEVALEDYEEVFDPEAMTRREMIDRVRELKNAEGSEPGAEGVEEEDSQE